MRTAVSAVAARKEKKSVKMYIHHLMMYQNLPEHQGAGAFAIKPSEE